MSESDRKQIAQVAQWIISGLFAFAFAVAGFVGKVTFEKIEALDRRFDELPSTYLTKDDFRHEQREIVGAISRLEDVIQRNREQLQADADRRMDKLEKLLIEAGRQNP